MLEAAVEADYLQLRKPYLQKTFINGAWTMPYLQYNNALNAS
jgi:hypothetical protein